MSYKFTLKEYWMILESAIFAGKAKTEDGQLSTIKQIEEYTSKILKEYSGE